MVRLRRVKVKLALMALVGIGGAVELEVLGVGGGDRINRILWGKLRQKV